MKKTIRKGVFETNSSSTHSICIASSDWSFPKTINFHFGEFGWEKDILKSIYDKASYLYTGLWANGRDEDIQKIFESLKSKSVEVIAEEPEFEIRSYEHNGKTITYRSGENTGYVDHAGDLKEFLDAIVESEDRLFDYLFSPLSFIITGNDNDDSDVDIKVSYPHEEYYKGN